jgi:hypothetical protein
MITRRGFFGLIAGAAAVVFAAPHELFLGLAPAKKTFYHPIQMTIGGQAESFPAWSKRTVQDDIQATQEMDDILERLWKSDKDL